MLCVTYRRIPLFKFLIKKSFGFFYSFVPDRTGLSAYNVLGVSPPLGIGLGVLAHILLVQSYQRRERNYSMIGVVRVGLDRVTLHLDCL